MTLFIPNWVGYLMALSAIVAIILWCIIYSIAVISRALKARHDYFVAVLFLTFLNQKAKDWTLLQFRQLNNELKKENPKFYAEVVKVFVKDEDTGL